ncbi:unnamed protein product [Nippostrongylus brasiliensis]|uniref:Protein kinase domain-containing protein n=1 Tax=Nippostrongylus brasiliensis TaxID=27835 RepID=A0A3P7AHP0_NIPBR|nr:unnamed protein product [Nippostrongylus brasiliensis]
MVFKPFVPIQANPAAPRSPASAPAPAPAAAPSGTAPSNPPSTDTKQSVDKEKQSAQRADKDKAENKSNENAAKPEDKEKKAERDKKAQEKKEKKKEKVAKREKMKENDILKSDNYTWRILKLLGSGGFGDVYKVVKEKDNDKQEYAMKTEMCEGDKRMLRLKIEVRVLGLCCNVENPEKRKHFLELVDRGKTEKFKFLVMGLVGKSLEDLRKNVVGRNYSKSTGMQCAYQTLVAIGDLHDVGYLHRDIKPQNFAVGLGEQEKTIYMLDFGIARKFTVGNTKQVKVPRLQVKFLGTLRFASRACHNGIEQGRKDDLETWIYMVRIAFYLSNVKDKYMTHSIKSIAKENRIDMERKLDWIGRTGKEASDDDETSSDNKNTGSEDSDDSDKNTTKRGHKKTATRKSDTRKKNTSMGRKKTGVSV